jgi:hypothetical protein
LEEDGKRRRCRLLVEQYEKRVMELHKVELLTLTAEGTKVTELKCDCSGFWEHTVCSHIWAVKAGVLTADCSSEFGVNYGIVTCSFATSNYPSSSQRHGVRRLSCRSL